MEITSRYDGVVKKVHYNLGEMAKVGSTLIDIEVDDATAASFQASAPSKSASSPARRAAPVPVSAAPKQAAPTPVVVAVPVVEVAPTLVAPLRDAAIRQRASGERVLTSPSVRRLAKEHDIDLLDVAGSGPGGRLLKEDLLEHIRMLASQPKGESVAVSAASAPAALSTGAKPSASYLEEDTVVALTRTHHSSAFACLLHTRICC